MARHRPEAAIWAYPWDLLDEGPAETLGRLAEAGIRTVSVASAYHTVRALCPHNPRRAIYHAEGGVVYFHPDPAHFAETPIRPVVSELAADADPLAAICRAAAGTGVRVAAWLVLTHNTRLGTRHPDCTIVNAYGDRYPFGLCPAHPHVIAYAAGLARSLAGFDGLDTLELESLGAMGIDHSGHHAKAGIELGRAHRFLMSLCFCPHCTRVMANEGVDADRARDAVRREMTGVFTGSRVGPDDPEAALAEVLGEDALTGIARARSRSARSMLAAIQAAAGPRLRLCAMVTADRLATGALAPLRAADVHGLADRLLVQTATGNPATAAAAIGAVARESAELPVTGGIQAGSPFVETEDALAELATAVLGAGARTVQFYHYGLIPLERLGWISRAVR